VYYYYYYYYSSKKSYYYYYYYYTHQKKNNNHANNNNGKKWGGKTANNWAKNADAKQESTSPVMAFAIVAGILLAVGIVGVVVFVVFLRKQKESFRKRRSSYPRRHDVNVVQNYKDDMSELSTSSSDV
jgi:beta-lactamase regulating signal transducer with metallopeptidase domain